MISYNINIIDVYTDNSFILITVVIIKMIITIMIMLIENNTDNDSGNSGKA